VKTAQILQDEIISDAPKVASPIGIAPQAAISSVKTESGRKSAVVQDSQPSVRSESEKSAMSAVTPETQDVPKTTALIDTSTSQNIRHPADNFPYAKHHITVAADTSIPSLVSQPSKVSAAATSSTTSETQSKVFANAAAADSNVQTASESTSKSAASRLLAIQKPTVGYVRHEVPAVRQTLPVKATPQLQTVSQLMDSGTRQSNTLAPSPASSGEDVDMDLGTDDGDEQVMDELSASAPKPSSAPANQKPTDASEFVNKNDVTTLLSKKPSVQPTKESTFEEVDRVLDSLKDAVLPTKSEKRLLPPSSTAADTIERSAKKPRLPSQSSSASEIPSGKAAMSISDTQSALHAKRPADEKLPPDVERPSKKQAVYTTASMPMPKAKSDDGSSTTTQAMPAAPVQSTGTAKLNVPSRTFLVPGLAGARKLPLSPGILGTLRPPGPRKKPSDYLKDEKALVSDRVGFATAPSLSRSNTASPVPSGATTPPPPTPPPPAQALQEIGKTSSSQPSQSNTTPSKPVTTTEPLSIPKPTTVPRPSFSPVPRVQEPLKEPPKQKNEVAKGANQDLPVTDPSKSLQPQKVEVQESMPKKDQDAVKETILEDDEKYLMDVEELDDWT
jgi:hypothetical protein